MVPVTRFAVITAWWLVNGEPGMYGEFCLFGGCKKTTSTLPFPSFEKEGKNHRVCGYKLRGIEIKEVDDYIDCSTLFINESKDMFDLLSFFMESDIRLTLDVWTAKIPAASLLLHPQYFSTKYIAARRA